MSSISLSLEDKQHILTRNLQSLLWKLSIPSILSMVLLGLNTLTDAVFVGRMLGETVLAGVALANPFNAIILGFGYWIGTGAANLLSISLGENDVITQKRLLPVVAILSLICSAIITLPVYYMADSLIGLMGGKDEVLRYGIDYFRTCLLGSFFWIYGMSLNLVIRGEGKVKEPAVMIALGLLVNILLTPLLIGVFDQGVQGAAWATNAGMFVLCLVQISYFLRGHASFRSNVRSLFYHRVLGAQIIRAGLPAFLFNIMALIQAVVVFQVINTLGDTGQIAFYAAANVIYLFLMTPLYGLMRAFQPVAGINFGAGQMRRIKEAFRLFTLYGLVIVLPFWASMTAFPEEALRLIVPDLVIGPDELLYFRVYLLAMPCLPMVFMALSFFPAIGRSSQASVIVLGRQLLLYIPAMLILPRIYGISGVYYGSTLVNMLIAAWTFYIIRQEMKKL